MRTLTAFDTLIDFTDQWLRRLSGSQVVPSRPVSRIAEPDALDADERVRSARLMRVNHTGEVAAQALYHGQALTAREPAVRETFRSAAREEGHHLAWTRDRLQELDSRPSLLGPVWYLGSLAIGAAAGMAGDRWSLGFVAETEHQVMDHLTDQIAKLPAADHASRAILNQMRAEEAVHATQALQAGGRELPLPVRLAMRLASQVMVRTSYWV